MAIPITPPSAVLQRKGPPQAPKAFRPSQYSSTRSLPGPALPSGRTAPLQLKVIQAQCSTSNAPAPSPPRPRPPNTVTGRPVIQRFGLQDLSGYKIKSDRVRGALMEIQKVLSNPVLIRYWVTWLDRQVQEISGRLQTLHPESDKWISVYSDVARGEASGRAMTRWKANPNKALDIALWRIERRWMVGMIRHTLTEDTGSSAEEFSKIARKVGALKDVGAPLQHGEYPHRIQWYVIYRHLIENGYSAQEVYAAYKETLKAKHTRVLIGKKLLTMEEAPIHEGKQQRSLWDRVVDIRLSERDTGVENALWASPLAVTAAFTPLTPSPSIPKSETPNRPTTSLPTVEDFSQTQVGRAVYHRLMKRKKQFAAKTRYSGPPVSAGQREQLNLGRELVNQSLAERLNLY